MKKLLAILFILLITTTYGQVDLTDKFRELFNENSYDEIIRYKPKRMRS